MLPKSWWKLNYFPVSANFNDWEKSNVVKDYIEFNSYLAVVKEIFGPKPTLHYTNNGYLKKDCGYYGWGIRNMRSSTTLELNVVWGEFMWRIVFMPGRHDNDEYGGLNALQLFRKYVKNTEFERLYGMKTNDEVATVKLTIPKPLCELAPQVRAKVKYRIAYEHCDHIDFNSAYAAQVAVAFPEIAPFFIDLYTHRKSNPENKEVLCKIIGANQSLKLRGKRFPILAKIAIEGTNETLLKLARKLEELGCEILSFNTDGIWYRRPTPDFIYHDENEGTKLGQWKRDHNDVTIRFKGPKCYEWIENGEYHHAASGIKPIYLQKWGDIYNHNPIQYKYDENLQEVVESEETSSKEI